jgi:hypothetical protein
MIPSKIEGIFSTVGSESPFGEVKVNIPVTSNSLRKRQSLLRKFITLCSSKLENIWLNESRTEQICFALFPAG